MSSGCFREASRDGTSANVPTEGDGYKGKLLRNCATNDTRSIHAMRNTAEPIGHMATVWHTSACMEVAVVEVGVGEQPRPGPGPRKPPALRLEPGGVGLHALILEAEGELPVVLGVEQRLDGAERPRAKLFHLAARPPLDVAHRQHRVLARERNPVEQRHHGLHPLPLWDANGGAFCCASVQDIDAWDLHPNGLNTTALQRTNECLQREIRNTPPPPPPFPAPRS